VASIKRKKKKLGSYPFVSVVLSICLALFVIGLFALLVLHTRKLTEIIKENVEMQVYLRKDITDNQRIQIQKTLSAKEYTSKRNDEVQISFISKEDAAQEFIKDTGEDFSEFIGENPLHDAYTIKIAPEYHEDAKMKEIQEDIQSINGVFEVVYLESLVESINKNVTMISFWLLGIALLLLIAVVLLINNTIKLALFSQRFLIRSMQLVGAKRGFIQGPFLKRSIMHGLLAGIFSSGMLYLLLRVANDRIPQLTSLQDETMVLAIFGSLLILGALIGFISTFRAINKYLNMSLDELY
jgi:cell division transport system permease protein